MDYTLRFSLPYTLGDYDHVTLEERLIKEVKSYLDDDRVELVYFDK